MASLFPNAVMYADEFPKAIIDTLYMLIVSGFISAVIGIFLGVIVVVTRKGGILENKVVFWILDKIINLFRSIPFIILVPTVSVLTRLICGSTIGMQAALVPLVIGTAPLLLVRWKPQSWKLMQVLLKQVYQWDLAHGKLSLKCYYGKTFLV